MIEVEQVNRYLDVMSEQLICFFVSPFGKLDSDERKNSDNLMDLIIKPALDVFQIKVIRGDEIIDTGRVDTDVVKFIQESELCIVDLSIENVNVYYELGRRDETGKPTILLNPKTDRVLPVDIRNRKYTTYDWQDLSTLVSAKKEIQAAVQSFIDSGMEKTKGTSLFAINEKIDRIERNIARLMDSPHAGSKIGIDELDEKEDPRTLFKFAMMQRNIPLAEKAMEKLEYSMDKIQFYDYIVEQVAALGSRKAGEMLIEYADTFMDSVQDNQKQIEYLGCLVTYLNRTDQEQKYVDKIERIALSIKDSDNKVPDGIFNQLSRLHHGIYETTKDETHLDKAIDYLNKAIAANPDEASYYYNVAKCYEAKAEGHDENDEFIWIACENVSKAVEMGGENYADDHLSLACRLFYRINDPKWKDYLDMLEKVSPARAYIIKHELK